MKQSENIDLIDTSERFLSLLKSHDVVVLILNSEGRYIEIANKATHLHYRPAKELLGKTVHELFPKDLADLCTDAIAEALKENKCVSTEYELNISNENIWFEAIAIPFMKNCVIWLARNITDCKKEEQIVLEAIDVIDKIAENSKPYSRFHSV